MLLCRFVGVVKNAISILLHDKCVLSTISLTIWGALSFDPKALFSGFQHPPFAGTICILNLFQIFHPASIVIHAMLRRQLHIRNLDALIGRGRSERMR